VEETPPVQVPDVAPPAQEPQAPEPEEQQPDPEKAASQQILKFLVGIKKLGGVDGRDLEAALFAQRFDLFPMGDSAAKSALPQFQSLPKKQLLKEFLMSGKLNGGYQSVAHVLYPESVQWPDQLQDGYLDADETPRQELGTAGSDRPTSRNSTASKRSKTRGPAPESSAVLKQRVFSDDDFLLLDEELDDSVQGKDERVVEVLLCGKPVHSTVRGKALKEVLPLHESSAVAKKDATPRALPEARFRAAQQARRKLERAVQLEEYQERRLAERIQALEIALDDETANQKELEKRQKKRHARQERLKKDLQDGLARKLEAEKWQAEEEKRKEDEKQKEKERHERYRQSQKERLEKWQEERSSYDFFTDPVERARFKRMEMEREADLLALEKREAKEERCPLRRLEVEARLQELEDCMEQRPFVPPKPHDRPKPVLVQLDEASGKVPPASTKPPAPKAGAWLGEARGLSKRYGLSAEHLRTVESHLQRSIKVPSVRKALSRELERSPRDQHQKSAQGATQAD